MEHHGQQSVPSWLLTGEDGLEVIDRHQEHLGPSGGVSGVEKCVVRAESGEPLPVGVYTFSIYTPEEEAGIRAAATRKSFAIQP